MNFYVFFLNPCPLKKRQPCLRRSLMLWNLEWITNSCHLVTSFALFQSVVTFEFHSRRSCARENHVGFQTCFPLLFLDFRDFRKHGFLLQMFPIGSSSGNSESLQRFTLVNLNMPCKRRSLGRIPVAYMKFSTWYFFFLKDFAGGTSKCLAEQSMKTKTKKHE